MAIQNYAVIDLGIYEDLAEIRGGDGAGGRFHLDDLGQAGILHGGLSEPTKLTIWKNGVFLENAKELPVSDLLAKWPENGGYRWHTPISGGRVAGTGFSDTTNGSGDSLNSGARAAIFNPDGAITVDTSYVQRLAGLKGKAEIGLGRRRL
ncbi:MAG: hypothetical protein HC904_12515 [Blastochloris sp.]|nr:hypothetical protein [Blastochloris sp.]